MSPAPTLFDPQLLQRGLRQYSGTDDLTLHYLQSCASTNRECQQTDTHGSVIVSDRNPSINSKRASAKPGGPKAPRASREKP